MVLMIIVMLVVFGLCLGSFVNALVWRLHEQEAQGEKKRPNKQYLKDLSITKGRSMCPHCKHELAAKDLVPLFSWLSLAGKCRYCRKPIGWQYPLVEALTAVLFIISYLFWPQELKGLEVIAFADWCLILTGLIALAVYDLKWMLLPDRILWPVGGMALVLAALEALQAAQPLRVVLNTAIAVIIGGGLFWAIYQASKGKMIGGGDVKLGWVLGLIVMTPGKSLLFIFLASVIGTIIALPFMLTRRLNRTSTIPYGPLLILGGVLAVLWGAQLLDWYQRTFIHI